MFFSALKTDGEEQVRGAGFLRVGILLFSLIGVRVEQLSVAGLNTLDVVFSIVFPFAVMYATGKITRPQSKQSLDRFFARMLTPVASNSQIDDRRQLARNIETFDDLKSRQLFPASDWVIEKPDKFAGYGLALYQPEDVRALLASSGFRQISMTRDSDRWREFICATGRK